MGREKDKKLIQKKIKTGEKKKSTKCKLTAINQERSYPKTQRTLKHQSANTIQAVVKRPQSKNLANQSK